MAVATINTDGLTDRQRHAAIAAWYELNEMGAAVRYCSAERWLHDTSYTLAPEKRGVGEYRYPIVKVHEVGDYAIVEHVREPAANRPDDLPRIAFESFVGAHRQPSSFGARRTGHLHDSLDDALLYCIVYMAELRHRGLNAAMNTRALGYIRRMIGPDGEET